MLTVPPSVFKASGPARIALYLDRGCISATSAAAIYGVHAADPVRAFWEVSPGAAVWHMSISHEADQRDLRMRSREIMDAVERGESFTVTRDGREVGELIPVRRPKRFVLREDFARASRSMPSVDSDRLRADLDAVIDSDPDDPFERAVR
jgi:prevent-host-death family protein